jgi:uncharacterized protein (DUF58 family)
MTFRLTREGRVFVLVTLGVGVGAVNTGNNLLFLLLGFFLSLLVLSGVMSEIALRGLRLERRLPERLFAGSTALVELALTNQKRHLSSYSLEVEDVADGVPTERRCYFLKVAPGVRQVASYRRTPRARGPLRLRALRVATRYPFGLVEKARWYDLPADVVVYPALGPVGPRAVDAALGGDAVGRRPGPGTEMGGLRAPREGDEVRCVHWRRSAALGRWVVRERLRDESAHVAIVLDNARPASASASTQAGIAWRQAFEARVSRAATLVAHALARGASVEVVVRGARSPLRMPGDRPDAIWRFLALLEPVPAEGAPPLAPATGVLPEVRGALTLPALAGDGPAVLTGHGAARADAVAPGPMDATESARQAGPGRGPSASGAGARSRRVREVRA